MLKKNLLKLSTLAMITVLISAGALGCGKKADAQAGKDTEVAQENAATVGVRENTTTKTEQGGENKETGAKEDETPAAGNAAAENDTSEPQEAPTGGEAETEAPQPQEAAQVQPDTPDVWQDQPEQVETPQEPEEQPQGPEEQPAEQPQEPVINTSHTNVHVVAGYGTGEYNRDPVEGGNCPYTLYQATSRIYFNGTEYYELTGFYSTHDQAIGPDDEYIAAETEVLAAYGLGRKERNKYDCWNVYVGTYDDIGRVDFIFYALK